VPQGPEPRLLIAPTNFAGQGRAWAQAWDQETGGSAVNWVFSANPAFGYGADYALPITVNAAPGDFQSAQFSLAVDHFQGVVMESGRALFGRLFGYSPGREALALRSAGLAVAALWHGSDIRLPSRHAASHRLSPYTEPSMRARTAELESTARRNWRAMGHLGLAQLVSTPDLLDQVEGAIWCPVVVDESIRRREGLAPVLPTGHPPRVVHVPSNPVLKGTDLVDPVLRRLADLGRIEYIRAEGLTAAEVLGLYESADIVADQFRMGIYGVAAAEAMALGRLVLSDVDQSVRQCVEDRTGLALPVCQVTAWQLEERLEEIIAGPEPFRQAAARGPAFVEAVHCGKRSAEALGQAMRNGADSG
jgi:hypothetical protein